MQGLLPQNIPVMSYQVPDYVMVPLQYLPAAGNPSMPLQSFSTSQNPTNSTVPDTMGQMQQNSTSSALPNGTVQIQPSSSNYPIQMYPGSWNLTAPVSAVSVLPLSVNPPMQITAPLPTGQVQSNTYKTNFPMQTPQVQSNPSKFVAPGQPVQIQPKPTQSAAPLQIQPKQTQSVTQVQPVQIQSKQAQTPVPVQPMQIRPKPTQSAPPVQPMQIYPKPTQSAPPVQPMQIYPKPTQSAPPVQPVQIRPKPTQSNASVPAVQMLSHSLNSSQPVRSVETQTMPRQSMRKQLIEASASTNSCTTMAGNTNSGISMPASINPQTGISMSHKMSGAQCRDNQESEMPTGTSLNPQGPKGTAGQQGQSVSSKPSSKVKLFLMSTSQGMFWCNFCPYQTRVLREVEEHVRSKHQPFTCPKCNKRFALRIMLHYHASEVHGHAGLAAATTTNIECPATRTKTEQMETNLVKVKSEPADPDADAADRVQVNEEGKTEPVEPDNSIEDVEPVAVKVKTEPVDYNATAATSEVSLEPIVAGQKETQIPESVHDAGIDTGTTEQEETILNPLDETQSIETGTSTTKKSAGDVVRGNINLNPVVMLERLDLTAMTVTVASSQRTSSYSLLGVEEVEVISTDDSSNDSTAVSLKQVPLTTHRCESGSSRTDWSTLYEGCADKQSSIPNTPDATQVSSGSLVNGDPPSDPIREKSVPARPVAGELHTVDSWEDTAESLLTYVEGRSPMGRLVTHYYPFKVRCVFCKEEFTSVQGIKSHTALGHSSSSTIFGWFSLKARDAVLLRFCPGKECFFRVLGKKGAADKLACHMKSCENLEKCGTVFDMEQTQKMTPQSDESSNLNERVLKRTHSPGSDEKQTKRLKCESDAGEEGPLIKEHMDCEENQDGADSDDASNWSKDGSIQNNPPSDFSDSDSLDDETYVPSPLKKRKPKTHFFNKSKSKSFLNSSHHKLSTTSTSTLPQADNKSPKTVTPHSPKTNTTEMKKPEEKKLEVAESEASNRQNGSTEPIYQKRKVHREKHIDTSKHLWECMKCPGSPTFQAENLHDVKRHILKDHPETKDIAARDILSKKDPKTKDHCRNYMCPVDYCNAFFYRQSDAQSHYQKVCGRNLFKSEPFRKISEVSGETDTTCDKKTESSFSKKSPGLERTDKSDSHKAGSPSTEKSGPLHQKSSPNSHVKKSDPTKRSSTSTSKHKKVSAFKKKSNCLKKGVKALDRTKPRTKSKGNSK